ncbi:MAG: response regulator [Planctomycetota bacterium]
MADYTILVCDDEPHILNVVSTKLRNGGFDVVTAADGEEAFELSQEASPDLVITDYQMPLLSGLELCAKLRSQEATRDTPVIMLTARGFSMNDDALKETNIRKVLPKPFSPRELLRCTQEILSVAAVTAAPVPGGLPA